MLFSAGFAMNSSPRIESKFGSAIVSHADTSHLFQFSQSGKVFTFIVLPDSDVVHYFGNLCQSVQINHGVFCIFYCSYAQTAFDNRDMVVG